MILLDVQAVRKHYGPEPVLDGVTFELRPGERVGLVGPNGAGKTTLLRILAGDEEADAGSVALHASARLGMLQQHAEFPPGKTAWDVALEGLADLVALAHEVEHAAHQLAEADDPAEHRRLAERYDRLQHELQRRNGYHLDHRVERVLDGLGLPREAAQQPAAQLSGGQQNRLLLARLLLADPDVLLLDEPSNHLDLQATAWLEDYLAGRRGAVIVVSHDRYFLDKVTNRTLELFRGTVDSYAGNFSAYWKQKAERVEVQRRTYEKQQLEIAKAEDFIRRNHYGLKHAQAEDRRKKLERIERVAPPREIAAAPMAFPAAARCGDVALRVEHLAKAFDRPLFADLSFDVQRGQRWGILGPNASGKTTLLRCVMGQVTPDAGRVIPGKGVRPGYLDQLTGGLDAELEAVEAIRPAGKEFNEQQRRDMLARFGLQGDIVFQRVEQLSGGERSRAGLARLAADEANLLVLDEPTNHLDLWARDALEQALKKFDGTVLLVSHDRYFLNRVVDHLLVASDDGFRVIEGNYDTYQHFIRAGLADEEPQAAGGTTGKPDKKTRDDRADDTRARRRRRFPYRKVGDIEAEIFEHEEQIEAWQQALTEPDTLRDGDRVRELKSQIEAARSALQALYEHWEEATELN